MKYILAFYALEFAFCMIIYGFYKLKKAEEVTIEKLKKAEEVTIEKIDDIAKKLNSVSRNIILKDAKPVDYDKCMKALHDYSILHDYSMGLAEMYENDIIERIAEDSFLIKRRFK